jgi:UDP-N-acetylmuramate dehydrogenase
VPTLTDAPPSPPSDDQVTFLRATLGAERVRAGEVLAPYTTFRVGGPADLFYEAHSADELAAAVTAARAAEVPTFLLGMGANILVGDLGVRGFVIRNRAAHVEVDHAARQIRAESGAVVYPDLIEVAVSAGLSGLEHYVGIPSTVGGALWQNLHFLSPPPERERTMFIEEVVLEAEILTPEGERKTVGHDYFRFGYDYSILHDRDDLVLSATFQLQAGEEARMREVMAANLDWRRERHPPLDTEPSAGSIFKKIEGVGAGRLIDWCGLKGARIGGAMVTHRHANILINAGGATAADVRHLITYIQRVVEREQGYRLSTEIGFIGDFGALPGVLPKGWESEDGFTDGLPPGGHPEAHRDAERR